MQLMSINSEKREWDNLTSNSNVFKAQKNALPKKHLTNPFPHRVPLDHLKPNKSSSIPPFFSKSHYKTQKESTTGLLLDRCRYYPPDRCALAADSSSRRSTHDNYYESREACNANWIWLLRFVIL